jgi:hypothetical protein
LALVNEYSGRVEGLVADGFDHPVYRLLGARPRHFCYDTNDSRQPN